MFTGWKMVLGFVFVFFFYSEKNRGSQIAAGLSIVVLLGNLWAGSFEHYPWLAPLGQTETVISDKEQ